jgi:hypothetical protein
MNAMLPSYIQHLLILDKVVAAKMRRLFKSLAAQTHRESIVAVSTVSGSEPTKSRSTVTYIAPGRPRAYLLVPKEWPEQSETEKQYDVFTHLWGMMTLSSSSKRPIQSNFDIMNLKTRIRSIQT